MLNSRNGSDGRIDHQLGCFGQRHGLDAVSHAGTIRLRRRSLI